MKKKILRITILILIFNLIIVKSQSYIENFEDFANLEQRGWFLQNNSKPIGDVTNWFEGGSGIFNAYNGSENSFISSNFNTTTEGGTISNWLLSPVRTLKNGDTFSFYTRTDEEDSGFYDRLEIRYSINGVSTDVGSTEISVGDFSNLMLTINPDFKSNIYPTEWTLYTVTVTGLSEPISGRFAFRYFIEDTSLNGNYIGIDQVEYKPYDESLSIDMLATNENKLLIFLNNPVEDILKIKSDKVISSVNIFSSEGRKLLSFDKFEEMNVQQLPTGIYFVNIHFNDSKSVTKKLIKK